MKFKIGIAEKRVVSHEQIIGLSPSTGRTRDDHGLGNDSWAQGIPRKNGSPRICTPHGHENGPCFRLSPWTDVVFAGRRNDWFAVHSSRPAHSLDGTVTLTEERFQQSAASRVTAVGSCAGTVYLHCRCNARQAGEKTQNVIAPGMRQKKKRSKGYRKRLKSKYKKCHSFTFGLLITPSGIRIPYQIPHYTKEYCAEKNIPHRTTAEAAADMIRDLSLPEDADVVVLGDTAYDAKVVRQACEDRNYLWITPANPERVYEGSKGNRPRLRSRLKDWTGLSLKTIRLRASTGRYADYRRLSRWRVGPKQKPRAFYAHQEKSDVRSVGRVQLVFSTTKQNLKSASPDDVKILMTNALTMSVSEVIERYSLRWQIELFFKELKSTLGFSQYSFHDFQAVEGWANIAITTVLYLETERARKLQDRRSSKERRDWWRAQRLHGLCLAFRQECEANELK